MNMFKSRRKAKEQSDTLDALISGPPLPPPATYKTMKNMKRKNKNIPEDTKPAFDLSKALPDDKEFRTSLLMPNLSARFSMLREQDDPNTKLGKASDDSVLFPKRASRLNLFSHTALADVAEDESTLAPIRPPFADRDRSNSVGDGYESDGGSIMNRSRLGEGNTLFGGRQKMYRIPTSSARNLTDTDGTVASRHVYEHDVSMSRYQQFRRKEKEQQLLEDTNRISVPATDGGDSSEIASPATAFSANRGTQSSTNSLPRRSSTAATSVASERLPSRNSETESLSNKSSDHIAHTSDSTTSLPITKTRDDPIPNRFASISRGDRFQRPGPFAVTPLRNASSPVVPMAQPLDFGFKTESRSNSATGRYQTDSPTPSLVGEDGSVLANNVQPNDRGKATALGLFNKPAREFDEHQFSQRQLQMHEGQVSTMSNNSRSASRASDDAQKARQDSISAVTEPSQMSDDRESTRQIPPVPDSPSSPGTFSNRTSKASGRSPPPRPRSKSSASATATANVKARVESLIRKNNAELAALEAEKLGSTDPKQEEDPSENKENVAGPFFDNDDDDESEVNSFNGFASSRGTSIKVDESDIHPAFRNSFRVSEVHSRKSNYSNFSRTRSVVDDEHSESSRLHVPALDSDSTTNQQTAFGLSGLIRAHLRHDSEKSFTLPRPDSSVTPTTEPSRAVSIASTSKTMADSFRSEPFDLDLNQRRSTTHISQAPPTPTAAVSRAAAAKDATEQDTMDTGSSTETSPDNKDWREDLEPRHQRGGSSETTKERREFDEELAERRRKIRAGLRSVAERDRSQSPSLANQNQSAAMQAMQQRVMNDPQPKAMKMLGLQSSSQTSLVDEDRGRNMSLSGENRGRIPESGFRSKQTATYARFGPQTNIERHATLGSVTPPSSRRGARERSHSNVADRSRSRPPPSETNPPSIPGRGPFTDWSLPTPSPSDEPYSTADSSKSTTNGYLGAKPLPPDLKTAFPIRPSPKPSPITPLSPYESPMEVARPSPGPHSSGRTTPGSDRSTPTGFSRKRSVTKTMISEPTFLSSTSSVSLVHLPTAQQNSANTAPPLPAMNPRRRGNTAGDRAVLSPVGSTFSRSTPLEPVPASPVVDDFGFENTGRMTNSPSPRRLRKATSEGGSMAAQARHQAMMAELAHAKGRSPALPVFPNRSATTLGLSEDGGMF